MDLFLGIISGVLIMIVMYVLSMLGYFKLRQIKSGSKYSVEIIILAFAVIFSMGVKAVIIFICEPANENFWQSMANTFKAVYSGIGGLTFDGLSDFEQETVSSLVQCLYAGSSLYAGIMILSVLTAKISYEIYSAIRKVFGFKSKMLKGNTDFYIFTAVTEETITLAESITNYHSSGETGRKCEILFIGPDLEAFDAKNELHREVMANGYYYWAYSRKATYDKGIFNYLRLPLNNDFILNKPIGKEKETRVHFFAMDTNEKLSGLESANSGAVFSEIESLLNKMIKIRTLNAGKKECEIRKSQVIDFYVLTDNDINYEFYKRSLYELIGGLLEKKGVDYNQLLSHIKSQGGGVNENISTKENVVKHISNYFQFHIINEADLAAKCLEKQRQNVFLKNADISAKQSYVEDSIPDSEGLFRVMVLGFGTNGQQSMKYLYRSTAYADEDHIPSRFVADVYDPQTAFSAGLFGFNHPMFICVDKGSDLTSVKADEWQKEEKHVQLTFTDTAVANYGKAMKEDISKLAKSFTEEADVKEFSERKALYENQTPSSFADVKNYLKFPVVAFHKVSAFEDGFLKYLDDGVGETSTIKSAYKAFIIAMGNDELNIMMANSLIADIMHERVVFKNKDKQFTRTIYVNIRDKNNYSRINWTEENEKKLPNVKVVVYGASEQMFSYQTIINDEDSMMYNFAYSKVSALHKTDALELILNFKKLSLKDVVSNIQLPKSNGENYYFMRNSWLIIDAFKKQSNYAISAFSQYYKCIYELDVANDNCLDITNKIAVQLSAVEHERWLRFHICNGWFFNPERCDQIKEHDCICSFNMLKLSSVIYDLINVAVSMKQAEGERNDG